MTSYDTQLKALGFGMDQPTVSGYRVVDGFGFIVRIESEKLYSVNVSCAVHSDEDQAALNEAMQSYMRQNTRTIRTATYDGKTLRLCCAPGKLVLDIENTLPGIMDHIVGCLKKYNAMPACARCGKVGELSVCAMQSRLEQVCEACYSRLKHNIENEQRQSSEMTENLPLGLVGAFLGGLAGAVLWVLFSLMGRIVILAGVAAAVAAAYAYKWLAKKASGLGLGLALGLGFVVLLAGMYFATGLDVLRLLHDAGYNVGFGEALGLIPDYIRENTGAFLFNNIFGVLSYIGGAVLCVLFFKRSDKEMARAEKLM